MGNELNPLSLFSESNDDGQYVCGVYTGPPEENRRRRREKKKEKSANAKEDTSLDRSLNRPTDESGGSGKSNNHQYYIVLPPSVSKMKLSTLQTQISNSTKHDKFVDNHYDADVEVLVAVLSTTNPANPVRKISVKPSRMAVMKPMAPIADNDDHALDDFDFLSAGDDRRELELKDMESSPIHESAVEHTMTPAVVSAAFQLMDNTSKPCSSVMLAAEALVVALQEKHHHHALQVNTDATGFEHPCEVTPDECYAAAAVATASARNQTPQTEPRLKAQANLHLELQPEEHQPEQPLHEKPPVGLGHPSIVQQAIVQQAIVEIERQKMEKGDHDIEAVKSTETLRSPLKPTQMTVTKHMAPRADNDDQAISDGDIPSVVEKIRQTNVAHNSNEDWAGAARVHMIADAKSGSGGGGGGDDDDDDDGGGGGGVDDDWGVVGEAKGVRKRREAKQKARNARRERQMKDQKKSSATHKSVADHAFAAAGAIAGGAGVALKMSDSIAQHSPAERVAVPSTGTVTTPRSMVATAEEEENAHESPYSAHLADKVWRITTANEFQMQHGKCGPKRVALIVDYSGSMYGAKIRSATKNLESIVRRHLTDDDSAMLIHFTNFIYVDFDILPIKGNADMMISKITSLAYPTGTTALYDAIGIALNSLSRSPTSNDWIIALTDGEDNASKQWSHSALGTRLQSGKGGPNLIVIGVGSDIDARILEALAQATAKGRYIFTIGDQKGIDEAFGEAIAVTQEQILLEE